MLKDSQQRKEATSPNQSFIVQAPAGSGKTEILTQRFLRLLSLVNQPEQIVALTFTRKAASEMRERIILALQKVAKGEEAKTPHQQQTFDYAAKALARSEVQNWQLLEQSSRLRILTIDSFCQMLVQAIPLREQHLPFAQIAENPEMLYRQAARDCFSYALEDDKLKPALKSLLIHLDNRQDKLLDLLAALLANREQWLPFLYLAKEQKKSGYEQMLALIIDHELTRFQQAVVPELAELMVKLARTMASIENDPNSPRYRLINWQSFKQINRDLAAGLASLLLKSDGQLRKNFDHHVGLKRGACEDFLYEEIKTNSADLLANLSLYNDFADSLNAIKNLPDPSYDSSQWQVLQALFDLLPFLVGHLQLAFANQNEVDFSAIAQQALDALGDEEQPTDLALYLDSTIHHLLVDEFQDTSIQQFKLLSKLVQGWQNEDGRTLFVVGDPMQSIYRFRQAEVGLFLKAKQNGLGPIHLTNLELCCNFRSTSTIVNWVNEQFKTIFPQNDDIESGAISFSPSTHVQEDVDNSYVKALQLPTRQNQALALVQVAVELLQNHPKDKIAILVRSRTQLREIISVLRAEQVPFQGVEIELLAKLPHLRDLFNLTLALLRPANRLAWLALLRSPFCGLTLADLYWIANFDKRKSIYYALSKLEELTSLSEEGRVRANFVYTVLSEALASRHQQAMVDWVRATVKALHGDLIFDARQQKDLQQFWLVLERFTKDGQLPDFKQFREEFAKLYSQNVDQSRLQVMTIHKSKGLEFDSVILPSLSASSQIKEQPLLRWLKLPSQTQSELFLVSPIKAAYREDCLVYNYLAKLDAEKDSYELQRLFYVAATRAKKRLYLFDCQEKDRKNSFRNLMKNQEFLSLDVNLVAENELKMPLLKRLPTEFYETLPAKQNLQTNPLLSLSADSNSRQLGIVFHELLQWVCENHPTNIEDLPWPMILNQFKRLGFNQEEQEKSYALLREQVARLFEDPIGQWLSKAHEEERNEYELLINAEGQAATRIIDRTFLEKGLRWIIDFKTGSEEEETQEKHRKQVNEYARLLAMISAEPIRCGLYYLASGNWVHWEFPAGTE